MAKSKSSRGTKPSESTIRILWGKTAGICEYKGCSEKLFYDETTAYEFNSAYIAHIVASSPDGPRGDLNRSHQLSDKIENIMLLCDKHHRLIDIEDVKGHPEELLLEMKREHEKSIEEVCNYLNIEKTEVVNFSSSIKGNKVTISYTDTIKAVLHKKQPADQYGKIINLESVLPIDSLDYWQDLNTQLEYNFLTKIRPMYDRIENIHMSVFALAPIPLIIKLGSLFGDKTSVDVYQKTRIPDTWCWQTSELTNMFYISNQQLSNGKDIAIIVSLTDTIDDSRVISIFQPNAIYRITSKVQGVDCIKSEKDLSEFWHAYQRTCDEIINTYGTDSIIHLFPAIPVSAAFEVGRRHMPKLYPQLLIYDECNGFRPTLSVV